MTYKTSCVVAIAVVVCVSVTSRMARPQAGQAIAPWRDHRAVEPGPAPSDGGGERPGPRAEAIRRHVSAAYGQLPLAFIENTGQLDSRVKFYERGVGRTTFLTAEGVYVELSPPPAHPAYPEACPPRQVVTLTPVGMRQHVAVVPEGRQEGTVHYLVGNDPAHWRTHVPTYSAVVYQEAYPGIDIRFYGSNRELEYDVVVKRGADPSTARFAYGGIAGLAIGEGGELRITLPGGEVLEQRKPVIYQEVEGTRVEVAGEFRLYGQEAYGFTVSPYDRERPLIIDPVLRFSYSTYLGGAGQDEGYRIAVDAAGQAYVTGWTYSPKFPTTPGALDSTYDRYADVFVTKLNAAGSRLVYSTYLGGTYRDEGYSIAVDAAGRAYVTGSTYSPDFPTTPGAVDTTYDAQSNKAFVTKLNAAGSRLVYSTYPGGTYQDEGYSIAVDAAGRAYVTGRALSWDFPTTRKAFDRTDNGYADVFVTKLNAAGSRLGRVDELFNDNPCGHEMNQRQEGLAQFLIPRGNTAKLFQVVEEAFDLLA